MGVSDGGVKGWEISLGEPDHHRWSKFPGGVGWTGEWQWGVTEGLKS